MYFIDSDSTFTSLIEDFIDLAIDSDIADVIIACDFNLNIIKENQFCRVEALCNQFNLFNIWILTEN